MHAGGIITGMNLPDRSLKLTGASNFRDLGGYRGHGGRALKWRKIFRSDHLGELNAADIDTLHALNLTRVCDFRGVNERVAHPCALPGPAVHALSIEPTVVQAIQEFVLRNQTMVAADAVRMMQDTYRAFVTDNSARFAELFGHLLHEDSPLVFHCTAGKDRTGFAAALILSALGVPRDVVMQDYLLTNDLYRAPSLVGGTAPAEVRDAIRRVQPDYLQASLDVVDRDFGGMENYLEKTLGLGASERKKLEYFFLN